VKSRREIELPILLRNKRVKDIRYKVYAWRPFWEISRESQSELQHRVGVIAFVCGLLTFRENYLLRSLTLVNKENTIPKKYRVRWNNIDAGRAMLPH